jgi:hypothetical protein
MKTPQYCCQQEERRDAVRRRKGWNGIDYVEVDDSQRTLRVYFLGKLPPELHENKLGLERFLRVTGGHRVTDIQIVDVDPTVDPDQEKDDFLVVQLDKYGDYSTYTLRLVGVKDVDPRYDHVDFSFKVNCPSDLDCAPVCKCAPPLLMEPEIDYLAKDYASFRQLILDRLALLVPDWQERHVPDLGIALVELLAYVGDYLSYYQDAVATEAYLDTARRRISVRRHARLVDYNLHEGCNARTWLSIEVGSDLTLDPTDAVFITGSNDALTAKATVLNWDDLRDVPHQAYEAFEPLLADKTAPLKLLSARSEIHFYTWGDKQCCLERGSTSATLLDAERKLQLERGDVLIFEEVRGAKTGLPQDADPVRRQAVRLTAVKKGEDSTIKIDGHPTSYLVVEWGPEDALRFPFCISAIGAAPDCKYLENISVARGNVLLVDHGRTLDPKDIGKVPTLSTEAICECAETPGEIQYRAGKFGPHLGHTPLTFREALPADSPQIVPAASFLQQDVRAALPQVELESTPSGAWQPRFDLVESFASEEHFVVEIDNDGVAYLRFGDSELGNQPPAGMSFRATYRIGNGVKGNVGADSISRLVLKKTKLVGDSIAIRNPLPATGGTDPEPIAEAKLMAPRSFRKTIQRAIIAQDYEEIAERNRKVQNASAVLVWTGSWYEADVAIDPFGSETPEDALLSEIEEYLDNFRRIGHDLDVKRAHYVPLYLKLMVCALPHYQRAHLKAELLDVFSNRVLTGGGKGFFHPDNLTFGEGIYLSRIVAAGQKVEGVECVTVTCFRRLFESPNHEIENGLLPLRNDEIAQLDNDPNYPERGKLEIVVGAGR